MVERHAVHLAVRAHHATLPLVQTPKRPAHSLDDNSALTFHRGGSHREHSLPLQRYAPYDAVVAAKPILPFILYDPFILQALAHLADLVRLAVDLQHVVAVAGYEVHASVLPEDSAEELVFAVCPVPPGAKVLANLRHTRWIPRDDLKNRVRVRGDPVDGAVHAHRPAVPLPPARRVLPVQRALRAVRTLRVDPQNRFGVLGYAVDAPVGTHEPAVPLVATGKRRADELARIRGRIDLQDALRELRDAVDAPVVRRQHAAVELPQSNANLPGANLGDYRFRPGYDL